VVQRWAVVGGVTILLSRHFDGKFLITWATTSFSIRILLHIVIHHAQTAVSKFYSTVFELFTFRIMEAVSSDHGGMNDEVQPTFVPNIDTKNNDLPILNQKAKLLICVQQWRVESLTWKNNKRHNKFVYTFTDYFEYGFKKTRRKETIRKTKT
jgi:hypothetical protein